MTIYTDGACRGNPGPGGFGVVIFDPVKVNEIKHVYRESSEYTTNNREELKAILYAMNYVDDFFLENPVLILSDSAYCVNILNDWIFKWAQNGWKRKDNQPIENLDLIKELYKKVSQDFYHCQVYKIPGHSGCIGNELADALATNNNSKFDKIIKEYNIVIENYKKLWYN